MKISIVDDHAMVRDGLSALIQQHSDIEIACVFTDGRELIQALPLSVDVILLDIRMKDMNGIAVISHLADNHLLSSHPCLMLTYLDEPVLIEQGMSLGARGYLNKDADIHELLLAINTIAEGRRYCHTPNPKEGLFTPRELSIIRCLDQGLNNDQIAEKLHLSLGTVKNYNTSIYAKLNVKQRPAAMTALKQLGFI